MSRYQLKLTDGTLEVVLDDRGLAIQAFIRTNDGVTQEWGCEGVPLAQIGAAIREESPDAPLTETWVRIVEPVHKNRHGKRRK